MKLRLGTRRSALATTQSGMVADQLRELGHEVEIVTVVTEGDTNRAPLTQIGGTGVFASALREELIAGTVDLAVHSLKDLPTAAYPGLTVAAVPHREEPHDVLVTRGESLAELAEGAVFGTGSPRRSAQIRDWGRGFVPVAVRGNVETRLALVDNGDVDAIILARAGLSRLGLLDRITEVLPLEVMVPAPGQGALAVECRADDPEVRAACAVLDHAVTRAAVEAERHVLAIMEAGCTAPIGALALPDGAGELRLTGYLGPDEGQTGEGRRAQQRGSIADPRSLADQLVVQWEPRATAPTREIGASHPDHYGSAE